MKSPSFLNREAIIIGNQREAEGANSDSDILRKSFCMDSYRLRAALGLRGVGGNAFPPVAPKNPPHPLRSPGRYKGRYSRQQTPLGQAMRRSRNSLLRFETGTTCAGSRIQEALVGRGSAPPAGQTDEVLTQHNNPIAPFSRFRPRPLASPRSDRIPWRYARRYRR